MPDPVFDPVRCPDITTEADETAMANVVSRRAQLPLPLSTSMHGNLKDALDQFAQFPYKLHPYSARNWGHPLHSLCSYPSKMKPSIASFLVSLFSKPGQTVLDPFSGAGTVPFEACIQGRRGIAGDLSPLAYSLSAAKVNPPSKESTLATLSELRAYLQATSHGNHNGLDEVDEEISAFFHPRTMAEVMAAREFFLGRETENRMTPADWAVRSCIAHILHGNRPYALSRRSHGIIPIPPKGEFVYKPLFESLEQKVARLKLNTLPPAFKTGTSYRASALCLPLPDSSADVVITSPPFLGTTDFLRQNRVRLWFCGWDYGKQDDMKRRKDFIEYHKTLNIYRDLLTEFLRVVVPEGLIVLHVGVVKKVDMARELAILAQEQRMSVIATLYEDTTRLESHGRTDRGATHQHAFLFLRAK